MLHDLAVLSASSLLEYLRNQLSKPIVIEDIVQPVTINEDGEEEYESISQMPSQTSRTSQVIICLEILQINNLGSLDSSYNCNINVLADCIIVSIGQA